MRFEDEHCSCHSEMSQSTWRLTIWENPRVVVVPRVVPNNPEWSVRVVERLHELCGVRRPVCYRQVATFHDAPLLRCAVGHILVEEAVVLPGLVIERVPRASCANGGGDGRGRGNVHLPSSMIVAADDPFGYPSDQFWSNRVWLEFSITPENQVTKTSSCKYTIQSNS